jgi:DNA uptake protein ComE-like DNA-binding protein
MSRRLPTLRLLSTSTLALLLACESGARDAARDSAAGQTAPPTVSAATDTGAQAAAPAAGEGAMLDPNSATREQLLAAPGMTPASADALIAGRPYANMVAVNRALSSASVDSAQRKSVYARVWKPIDLNSATGEEILLIPGVGPRMRHEFEEYRPYKNIDQFRREIGKYVDKNEVARLEKYVTIK